AVQFGVVVLETSPRLRPPTRLAAQTVARRVRRSHHSRWTRSHQPTTPSDDDACARHRSVNRCLRAPAGGGAGWSSMGTIGQVLSVNVGAPRSSTWQGRDVTSAIWKQPVAGRHRLQGVNIDGDDQADRRVHGGPTKAVYAYAAEDYEWWAAQ